MMTTRQIKIVNFFGALPWFHSRVFIFRFCIYIFLCSELFSRRALRFIIFIHFALFSHSNFWGKVIQFSSASSILFGACAVWWWWWWCDASLQCLYQFWFHYVTRVDEARHQSNEQLIIIYLFNAIKINVFSANDIYAGFIFEPAEDFLPYFANEFAAGWNVNCY